MGCLGIGAAPLIFLFHCNYNCKRNGNGKPHPKNKNTFMSS
jgi:hypothetical protein